MMTATDRAASFFQRQSERLTGHRTVAGKPPIDAQAALVEKFGRFEQYGFKPDKVRERVGDALVAVNASSQIGFFEVMGQVAPLVQEAFASEVIPFAEDVVDKWPTATGLSRSLLTLTFSLVNGIPRGQLRSAAPYSTMIKWGKQKTPSGYQPGSGVWTSLVARRGRALALKMAEVVGG
jgi:hypothetical protein